ncbi:hypothetical protein F4808DRAFT_48893 [Astrocystis sublimbata]|nr:hypothetical protein F4808DRAFT_48893 [Astrocystis sublimbata]
MAVSFQLPTLVLALDQQSIVYPTRPTLVHLSPSHQLFSPGLPSRLIAVRLLSEEANSEVVLQPDQHLGPASILLQAAVYSPIAYIHSPFLCPRVSIYLIHPSLSLFQTGRRLNIDALPIIVYHSL